jgi:hypothetical protein
MWCGVFMNDKEDVLYWASRKAELRMEDIEAAQQKALKRFNQYSKIS